MRSRWSKGLILKMGNRDTSQGMWKPLKVGRGKEVSLLEPPEGAWTS